MDEDERCCGTGTCMINAEGLCWCGQQWNGHTMCRPAEPQALASVGQKTETGGAQEDTP